MLSRRRLRAAGVVQGVGFRPFVHQLATALTLTGHVGNDSAGVFIEVEGASAALDAFEAALRNNPPPLARIEQVLVEEIPALGETRFRIVESAARPGARTLVSPDIAVCEDCLREMADPADRRHRYPFINCTHCGPRYTLIRDTPYDRPATTMADFPLCEDCAREYADPANRRYHAQPIACPRCGPQLWLADAQGAVLCREDAALQAAQAALRAGRIVAVKGLGGFHLACDATNAAAVSALRTRKGRQGKPFALMVADLDAARRVVEVDAEAARLLGGLERPIVVLPRNAAGGVCDDVAPGQNTLGVMLPYTPLHHLLLAGMGPLVMTSGNRSETPILTDNAAALAGLADIADVFLLHNREIQVACDDSVVRVFEGHELPIRRARGYAPFPVRLPRKVPPLLAVGGELKAAFCLAEGGHAFLSQHLGDMERLETLEAFERAVAHLQRLFRITPEAVVVDRHPGYFSSRWARGLGLPVIDVQHHHAHIAALMAEHGLSGERPVLGLALDGTGYGEDGAVWGGEALIVDAAGARRAGQLAYVPLAGGDAAVLRPYRMALAHLRAADVAWDEDLPCVAACPPPERGVLRQQLERGINVVPTSSAGRLFDAVASALGICQRASYDAQPAIELEAHAALDDAGPAYPFDLHGADPVRIDAAPMWRALVADLRAGLSVGQMSARFHRGFVAAWGALAQRLCRAEGIGVVALSGGVFQNTLLLGRMTRSLRAAGLDVLVHRQVPPNDGGLALGQIAVAARYP
ncbi:MAG: carbamoyltransferase HypF [Thermoflexales bacterium]|nr:carbamoyltransferase HypF [Thermoflexales bacterium]